VGRPSVHTPPAPESKRRELSPGNET
jgi:hypothetical protein